MPNSSLSSIACTDKALYIGNSLGDCSASAWIVVDEQGLVAGLNAEAARLIGMDANQVLERPYGILPSAIRRLICRSLSSGQPVAGQQISLPGIGAEKLKLHLHAIPIRVRQAKRFAVIALIYSQSSAEKLQQTIQQLQRLASLGLLSAGIAHEIKNALVAIKTFAQLLMEKNRDAELARIVNRELQRVDSLISQMLTFASPGRTTYGTVAIHKLLNGALEMIQHQLKHKNIMLHRAYNAAQDVVRGNPHQLQQAFLNLLLNAADAMDNNGCLEIVTQLVKAENTATALKETCSSPLIQVTIKDNGIGITSSNMKRLFEPFFTTKRHGTGLGLSITRRIVQEHGGCITVESIERKGTTFNVLLPIIASRG